MKASTERLLQVASGLVIAMAVIGTLWMGYQLIQLAVLQKVNLSMQNQELQKAYKECAEKGLSKAP